MDSALKYIKRNEHLKKKQYEIFIVDDNEHFARYIEQILKRNYSHYRLSVINNPNDLIEKLSQKRVDLIILDINMPKMTGLQCAETFNKFFNFKIPILFVSANMNAESLISTYKLKNLYYFVPKPLIEVNFLEKMNKLLSISNI